MTEKNKKVLILHAPLGAGHGMAAKAIEEAFKKSYPDFEIKSISVLDFAFDIFRRGIPYAFNILSSRIPFLYKWMYEHFKRQSRHWTLNHASDVILKGSNFVDFLNDFNPNFILSTNPLPMQLVSLTKQQKVIDILSANVCTDFGFHSLWYNSDVNYYFVANENIKKALQNHGVNQEKIIITGIPISSRFIQPTDKSNVFKRLGLKENKLTLMIVGGTMEYNDLFKAVSEIQEKTQAQFIIIAGRDKNLQKKLEKSDLKRYKDIKIFNFVDNIQDYMGVSDLILTKAGGLTVSECMQKELPMIITDFIPGQEEDNVKYLVENGAGLEAKNTNEAIKIVIDLFSNTEKIFAMKKNCKKIAKPDAAQKLVDFVASKINNKKND
jgi:processive 1,2-diacylglycerol beta-glucosyltransferase